MHFFWADFFFSGIKKWFCKQIKAVKSLGIKVSGFAHSKWFCKQMKAVKSLGIKVSGFAHMAGAWFLSSFVHRTNCWFLAWKKVGLPRKWPLCFTGSSDTSLLFNPLSSVVKWSKQTVQSVYQSASCGAPLSRCPRTGKHRRPHHHLQVSVVVHCSHT